MKALGTITICGSEVSVNVGNHIDNPALHTTHGTYDPTTQTIWLDSSSSPIRLASTLVHEVLHAIMGDSGAIYATAAALGLHENDPRLENWEEVLVRILTPHVATAFGAPELVPADPEGV